MQNGVRRQDQEPHKTQSSHAAYAPPPIIQYFEVELKFIKVFVKAHKAEVDEIESEYLVEVPREAKGVKISLIPKDGCSNEEYEKACDLFIDLYQQMTQAMKMERFSLKSEENVVGARKKFLKYLEYLRKEEIEINRESGKDNGSGEFQVPMDVDPPDSSKGSKRNDPLETYMG